MILLYTEVQMNSEYVQEYFLKNQGIAPHKKIDWNNLSYSPQLSQKLVENITESGSTILQNEDVMTELEEIVTTVSPQSLPEIKHINNMKKVRLISQVAKQQTPEKTPQIHQIQKLPQFINAPLKVYQTKRNTTTKFIKTTKKTSANLTKIEFNSLTFGLPQLF